MKKIVTKLKDFIKNNYKIILIILCVAGLFYWFQVRPANIRTYCQSRENSLRYSDPYLADGYYARCLHKNGI